MHVKQENVYRHVRFLAGLIICKDLYWESIFMKHPFDMSSFRQMKSLTFNIGVMQQVSLIRANIPNDESKPSELADAGNLSLMCYCQ